MQHVVVDTYFEEDGTMFRKILVTVLALCLFVVPPIAAANSSHGGHAVSQPLQVAMLVPGNIKDGGFMEAGYQGLVKLEKEMAVKTAYIDGVKPDKRYQTRCGLWRRTTLT